MKLTMGIASREMLNGTRAYWAVQICTDGLLPFNLACSERSYAETRLAEKKAMFERFGDLVEIMDAEIDWPVHTRGVPVQHRDAAPQGEEARRD